MTETLPDGWTYLRPWHAQAPFTAESTNGSSVRLYLNGQVATSGFVDIYDLEAVLSHLSMRRAAP